MDRFTNLLVVDKLLVKFFTWCRQLEATAKLS